MYLVVGLGSLVAYLALAGGAANPFVVAALCALAGRPIWSGLADVMGRSPTDRTRRDDDA